MRIMSYICVILCAAAALAGCSSAITQNALETALMKAGVTSVRVIKTTDGSLAAWTSVSPLGNCPVQFVLSNGALEATKLQKDDGTEMSLKDAPNPATMPRAFAVYIADPKNYTTLHSCVRDDGKVFDPSQLPTG